MRGRSSSVQLPARLKLTAQLVIERLGHLRLSESCTNDEQASCTLLSTPVYCACSVRNSERGARSLEQLLLSACVRRQAAAASGAV